LQLNLYKILKDLFEYLIVKTKAMWISSDIFIQRPDNDQNITEVNANIIPMPGILWKSDRFRDITE
jgi:hypothetical protein